MMPSASLEGGIVLLTNAPGTPPLEPDAALVPGGAADMSAIERRLAPDGARAEPRQRAMASLRGRLSPAARHKSWPVADVRGDATPAAMPHLRRRARGDPEAVRAARHRAGVQPLADPEAVLVVDETGFRKHGRHSAGVARPSRGPAGRVEPGPIGLWRGYARALGHALLARARCPRRGPTTEHAAARRAFRTRGVVRRRRRWRASW
jgi:hypothetical protein